MTCAICGDDLGADEKAQQWGPEFAHTACVNAYKAGKADERERLRVLVEAVRDANMQSQDEDDCLIYTPSVHRAWESLMRGLEGPNDQANMYPTA